MLDLSNGFTKISTSSSLARCTHCGAVCSDTLNDEGRFFCCSGCQTVYRFITDQGLSTYYTMSPTPDAQTAQQEKIRDFTTFEDPSFCIVSEDGGRSITLYIEGIHCVACLWLLEKLPQLAAGVVSARVSMGESTLRLQLTDQARLSEIASTIVRLGYMPHLIHSGTENTLWKIENRRALIRLGVTGAIAGNLMLLSVSLYGGADGWYAMLFSWVSFTLCIPLVTWGAWPFYHAAFAALRMRRISIDVPIALALILGFLSSFFQLVRGADHLYFDSLGMLIFFLLGSRHILTLMQRKAHRGADLHLQALPTQATVLLSDNVESEMALETSLVEKRSVSELQLGDRVRVAAGDVIPVDGQVLAGESEVDLAWITGESVPQPVGIRSDVYAGTRNLLGTIYVTVNQVGSETRVGKLLAAIEKYPKSQFTQAIDRVAQGLLIAVLLIAAGALVFFGLTGHFFEGFNRVLALLIVTCPCALAMATPLALANGLGRAAASGILIRNPDVIESTAKITHVFLDKTGTLTKGYLCVNELVFLTGSPVSESEAHGIAYAMESQSKHPIGRAISRYYSTTKLSYLPVDDTGIHDLREVAGKGMVGEYRGRCVEMGAAAVSWGSEGQSPLNDVYGARQNRAERILTSVSLKIDGEEVLRYEVSDSLYADAATLIDTLRTKNYHIKVLSGDTPHAVARLAGQLGLHADEWQGGVSPEDKTIAVTTPSYAMMLGDGANDAVALKAATVGVAVHGSLEASMKAADVYLGQPGLGGVLRFLDICQQTRRVIRRNLVLSLVYNGVFCVAALLGWITPLLASVLMPLSSLTVVMSSMVVSRR